MNRERRGRARNFFGVEVKFSKVVRGIARKGTEFLDGSPLRARRPRRIDLWWLSSDCGLLIE